MNGLLTLKNLTKNKIKEVISLSLDYKSGFFNSYSGKKIATLFFENSTRTHYSFITAMTNLGITPIQVNVSASSISKGETLYDTCKTFEALGMDGLVIRHSKDNYFKELENINIPIFNAGDGSSNHPTQNLLDLVTIYEEFGTFEGLKICMIGDIAHSRVAHGNAEVMKKLGMEVYISGPSDFIDDTATYIDIDEAIKTCDVIMLLRVQFERHMEKMGMTINEYHEKYGIDMNKVNQMKKNAIIMHPAPFNRGVEIADEVCECEKSRIYKQMTNGVYTRMAVISMVLEGKL